MPSCRTHTSSATLNKVEEPCVLQSAVPSGAVYPSRYYLMGIVGVGKSTLRENLRRALPEASIYEEWPETMAAEVNNAMDSMSQCSAEEIQEWIFSQLATKNKLVLTDLASTLIIDRSPLDTFAFYPPGQWKARALQMLGALNMKSATPLAPGEIIFLEGSPKEVSIRLCDTRGYSRNTLGAQQSAFEIVIDYLAENYTYPVKRINTRNLNPEEVTQQALDIIWGGCADDRSTDDYAPLNIQKVVANIAAS